MENVLITGGAGYIGSVLTDTLLHAEEDYNVYVLDNFREGQGSLNHLAWYPNFKIIRGDCRERETLERVLPYVDWVLPLAAIVGAPACDEDKVAAWSTNQSAVELLMSLLKPHQKVVFPCTNSGYGVAGEIGWCDESSPLTPLSVYGRSKVAAEKMVLAQGGISLRLATVFGGSPHMRWDTLVNNFVYRAVYDGHIVLYEGYFRRNYIHIRDVAWAFLHAMRNYEKMRGQAYNVGLDEANLTKRELCDKIHNHVDFVILEAPAMYQDQDKRDYLVKNDKIAATGFKPAVTLDEGIDELLSLARMVNIRASQGNTLWRPK